MFRASSEMAVATTARSVEGRPQCEASSRPFWRADTMSTSRSMATRTSSAMSANLMMLGTLPLAVKVRKAFFQIERGRDAFQREPQLDHREGHLRLDPHDDGLRSAELDHVGDVAQRTERRPHDQAPRSGDRHRGDPAGGGLLDGQAGAHDD